MTWPKFNFIRVDEDEEQATIRLSRPEKHNAMGALLHAEMDLALTQLSERPALKVLTLTGEGTAFCAGMDLEECFLEPFADPDRWSELHELVGRWFVKLKNFPAVTVARVNGLCFGGGIELVGLCDLAIAADTARFGLSEINFGIFPGGGTTWAVSQHLGRKQALYYMLTGETFDATAARDLGLVNLAVGADDLDATHERLCRSLLDKNVHALRAVKRVYERSLRGSFADSVQFEMAALHELSYRSHDEWITKALMQFRRREFRPGLDAYNLDA